MDYYINIFMFNLTMILKWKRREKKRSTFFCTRKIIKTLGNDLFILRMLMHAAIYWQYRLVSRRMACGNKGVVGAVLF